MPQQVILYTRVRQTSVGATDTNAPYRDTRSARSCKYRFDALFLGLFAWRYDEASCTDANRTKSHNANGSLGSETLKSLSRFTGHSLCHSMYCISQPGEEEKKQTKANARYSSPTRPILSLTIEESSTNARLRPYH